MPVTANDARPGTRPGRRIPPSLFVIAFGLAGLADVWRAARPLLDVAVRRGGRDLHPGGDRVADPGTLARDPYQQP